MGALAKQVADLEHRCTEAESALAVAAASLGITRRVKVGDTWIYLPNYKKCRDKGVCTVAKVKPKANRVEFTDGGWNTLDSMETDPKWVLLGREYKPGDEDRLLEPPAKPRKRK